MRNEQFPPGTVDIDGLLRSPESRVVDFKATNYNTSDEKQKRNFAKDVASLANTPRDGAAYLVLGVKKELDGTFNLWGLDKDVDDSVLQSIATRFLDPTPRFLYQAVKHQGLTIGLIVIEPDLDSPIVPKETTDSGFERGKIYFRRGSQNAPATVQEQGQIWDWIRGRGLPQPSANPYLRERSWTEYLAEVDGFAQSARHILVTDETLNQDAEAVSGIASGPWAYVLDFDTRSDIDGFLATSRATLERRRALHTRVKGDPRTSRSPDFTTTWFFARGLEGRANSVPSEGIRSWRREYRAPLREEFAALAAELSPETVYVTILWRSPDFNEHLEEVLRTLDESFYDSLKPVFVSEVPEVCRSLSAEFKAPVLEMPFQEFARGVQQFFDGGTPELPGEITLPTSSGVPVQLQAQLAHWISEEIELVPLGSPVAEDDIGAFLRGGTASWTDLDRNVDARRDVQTRLTQAVRRDLEDTRMTRVNLFHRPGAGGTTVGRRVAWELHEEYACGLLRRTNPMETADRVARLYEETQGSVLLVADGTDIAERELDELAEYLVARRLPVVLLQVRRRHALDHQQRERTFVLDSQLSNREVRRFISTLSRDIPERADSLLELGRAANKSLHRPVYFALTAYERDFHALHDFVETRVEGLSEAQDRFLVFTAIALHFGQRPLPVGAFRRVLGMTPREPIDLRRLLPDHAIDMLIEDSPGEWRIGHSLVAEEILRQTMSRGADPRSWRNHLANWGIEFIKFCKGELPTSSTRMLDVVRRVFVFRDDVDILGHEQSAQGRFSNFIQAIPVSEGKLRVLNELVESFPQEHHFWAHLARFYALDRKDFDQAMEAANYAIQLSDHDSVVHHMRGMVRRYQLREMELENSTLDALVTVAEEASSDFGQSRQLNPENEYGYIAEAQMVIELLDHLAKSSGDLFEFLSRHDVPPYLREAFDRVESLLTHVKREREGVGASQYEVRASARVRGLYGDYSGAIQRLDSLTTRLDVYQPPIRRQLAWAYLSRAGGDWTRVSKRHLKRVLDLLSKNLEEEPLGEQNIRMWMLASRFQEDPPSLESVIEQVQYWRSEPGVVDAAYYAYVLNALLAMDGSRIAFQRYEQHLEECRELTRFRRNRDRSYEWVGDGTGIGRLVHVSRLGEWDRETKFWENTNPLRRVSGRISRINGPQAGRVELPGRVEAFFVPAKSGFAMGSENTSISTFLGFSYDGPLAWNVREEAN